MTNQPLGIKMEVMKEMEENMARKTKYYSDAKAEWEKANTYLFSVRLQRTTDADIIEKLEAAESRQGEVKRLVRLGIAYEQQGGAIQGVTAPAPSQAAPAPDKEIQRLARVGAEYEDMLRRGWVLVEPEKKEETTSESVQDALSRLQRVMEERRAKEAQQAEQKTE